MSNNEDAILGGILNSAQGWKNPESVDGKGKSSSSSKEFDGPPLVYIGPGITELKFFYNPATPTLGWREIARHKFNDVKCACLSSYGLDCPVCKVVNERAVNIMDEKDLYLIKKKYYILMYAKLISATDERSAKRNGQIVVCMFPPSLMKHLQMEMGTMDGLRAILSMKGNIYRIRCGKNIDGYYDLTRTPNLLDIESDMKSVSLKSLENIIQPNKVNETIITKANRFASDLSQYLSGIVGQENVSDEKSSPVVGMAGVPELVGKPNASAQKKSDGNPDCFGKYDDINPKCIACPWELKCDRASKKSPMDAPIEGNDNLG